MKLFSPRHTLWRAGVFNLAAGADLFLSGSILPLPTLNFSYGWAF